MDKIWIFSQRDIAKVAVCGNAVNNFGGYTS